MDYELFGYPNCNKCNEVKEYLNKIEIEYKDYNLSSQEGMKKLREYYPLIKKRVMRDSGGTIILPLILVQEEDRIIEVIQDKKGLEACLSKD